jgi:hypothetical protein
MTDENNLSALWDRLVMRVLNLEEKVLSLEAQVSAPITQAAEYETMHIAMKSRRVGRPRLLRAIQDGQVRSMGRPGPGREYLLLDVRDLNRYFPRIAAPNKKPQANHCLGSLALAD